MQAAPAGNLPGWGVGWEGGASSGGLACAPVSHLWCEPSFRPAAPPPPSDVQLLPTPGQAHPPSHTAVAQALHPSAPLRAPKSPQPNHHTSPSPPPAQDPPTCPGDDKGLAEELHQRALRALARPPPQRHADDGKAEEESEEAQEQHQQPEGEEDGVAHHHPQAPQWEEVEVPVPGVVREGLEAAEEGVVNEGGGGVIQAGGQVQDVGAAREGGGGEDMLRVSCSCGGMDGRDSS